MLALLLGTEGTIFPRFFDSVICKGCDHEAKLLSMECTGNFLAIIFIFYLFDCLFFGYLAVLKGPYKFLEI